MIHNVVTGLTVRFNAAKKIAEHFDLLWKYPTMCESELEKKAKRLAHQFLSDLNDEDIAEQMQHLPDVHMTNLGKPELIPLEILNLLSIVACNVRQADFDNVIRNLATKKTRKALIK